MFYKIILALNLTILSITGAHAQSFQEQQSTQMCRQECREHYNDRFQMLHTMWITGELWDYYFNGAVVIISHERTQCLQKCGGGQ